MVIVDGAVVGHWDPKDVGSPYAPLEVMLPKKDIDKVGNLPERMNAQSLDKITQADQILLMEKVSKSGGVREYWKNKYEKIGANTVVISELGAIGNVLEDVYGPDWVDHAQEEVLAELMHSQLLAERRNIQGRAVMEKLSEYKDGQLQKDGTWKFLPDNQKERNQLVEYAKIYDSLRIDVRKQNLTVLADIAANVQMDVNGDEYKSLRKQLVDQYTKEDETRDKASLYGFTDEGRMEAKLWQVARKRISDGDTPELSMIVGAVSDIAKVHNLEGFIEGMGARQQSNGEYVISDHVESKGPRAIFVIAQARMALEYGKGLSKAMWEGHRPSDHAMADVFLMNAIACEHPAKVEKMGKEIVANRIYEQRSRDIMDDLQERAAMDADGLIALSLNIGQSAIGMLRGLHESVARMYGVASNVIRQYTQGPMGWFRKAGESVADWIDNIVATGAPILDQYMGDAQEKMRDKSWEFGVRKLNRARNTDNFPEPRPRVGVGKVKVELKPVEV